MKKLFYLLAVILLTSCNNVPLELNVMSFNIRYDNPGDSLNSWQYRKDAAAQLIKDQSPDIVGAQEVLAHQLNDLKAALPDYSSVGVGRADGKDGGEFSPVLYNNKKFDEVKSGYFWLSESPEVAGSKGWDGACERIASWVVLNDKTTGKQVFAINTHLDHVGVVARSEGVKLLLKESKELGEGLPVIMTGDFNATPESDVIKAVIDPAGSNSLVHSRDVALEKKGSGGTFNDFGRIVPEDREFIDYIFVSKTVKVLEHDILPEKLNDQYVSDHVAVVAKVVIN